MPTLEELKNAKRVAWVTSFEPATIHVASREQRNILLRREPDGLAVSESYLSELTTVRVLEEFPEPTVEERLEMAGIVYYRRNFKEYLATYEDAETWTHWSAKNCISPAALARSIRNGSHFKVLKER